MSMQWVAILVESAIDMNDNHHKLMKSWFFVNNCTNWSHKNLISGMQCGFFCCLLGQTCCPLPKFHILIPLLCNPNGFDIISYGSHGNDVCCLPMKHVPTFWKTSIIVKFVITNSLQVIVLDMDIDESIIFGFIISWLTTIIYTTTFNDERLNIDYFQCNWYDKNNLKA
jgi:hypothetical protein